MRSRRSCLSVPGSSAKMLAKARGLGADEAILDLEDAVAPAQKSEARATTTAALAEGGWGEGGAAVRINGVDTPHCLRDVVEVVEGAGAALACFVIPKAESAFDVAFVDRLLEMAEAGAGRTGPVRLQALIETAAGLRRVHEIAHASPRLDALILGYADLSASLGRAAHLPYPGDRWHWARETLLVAARDAGLQAIDGPWLQIEDADGMQESAAEARALGFDGKWAIHPSQVGPINAMFTPSQAEFDRAAAELEALAEAERSGRGAVALGGAMLDEATRKQAADVVARGAAAGLQASPA
jgi:citrate lyase subunit beta / citryl-CoA lyase